MRFSDIHSHFVYGIDDGAQTLENMEAMLDAAAADGVSRLIATPHMTPGVHQFNEERFWRHLSEARAYCQIRGYALALYSGAEILYTPAMEHYMSSHRLPTLADSQCVLIEFTPTIPYAEIVTAVELLERNGYTPILAHVERYQALRGMNIYHLKEQSSALYQVNCNTIIESDGLLKDLHVRRWLRDELIDYVASDSHNCRTRRTHMRKAYTILVKRYGKQYADRLVGMI